MFDYHRYVKCPDLWFMSAISVFTTADCSEYGQTITTSETVWIIREEKLLLLQKLKTL